MRVVISEFMSLDGVVQAPGGATQDTSGGFQHGGWSIQFFDPDVMGAVVEGFAERNEVLLQGRRTTRSRPRRGPADPAVRRLHQRAQKYVVSDTLTDEDVAPGRRPRSSGARPRQGGLRAARQARRRRLRLRQPDRCALAAGRRLVD